MASRPAPPSRPGVLARLSLAWKLPLLMASLLAASALLTLGVTWDALIRSAEEEAHARLESAAEELASSAGGVLDDRLAALLEASRGATLRRLLREQQGAEEVRPLLQALAEGPSPATIELRGPDGGLVLRAGPEPGPGSLPPLPATPLKSTALEGEDGGAFAWSVVPVEEAGVPLGWLARRWRVGGPAGADRTVADLTGEAVIMHLRSADGSVWARFPGVLEASPPRSEEARTGALVFRWEGGDRLLAAERPVRGTPLIAVMETPLQLVHARAVRTVGSLALASLLIVLTGTALAWLLGRRMAAPLVALSRAAEALAAGDYDQRVGVVRADETGRLAAGFNHMADEVQSARLELITRIEQAQEARREAEALRASAEEARRSAEEANRAKSDFLAVMSHELRTPLNAIAGYAELLEMGIHGPLAPAQKKALQRIARNQAHLLTLIDDVLRYAQLEAGKVEYELRPLSVEAAVAELETFLEPQLRAAALDLVREPETPDARCMADPDKLHQVLLNLLSNAIKFTPPGGRVSVSWAATAEAVQITVRDTGVGIAPDQLSAVFDPFFQGHRRTDRPAPGVGLGLAISRDLARGMGGDLSVESAAGAGSAFTVSLPRDGAEVERAGPGAPDQRPSHATKPEVSSPVATS